MRNALATFLGRRRKGAVAIMAIAAMVPTAAMFSANLNTAQLIDERRQTQDAADALASMHATWTARSLNVISTNNVTAAQLYTLAIGSEALEGTLQEIGLTVAAVEGFIGGHAGQHCQTQAPPWDSWWPPICGLFHTIAAIPAAIYGIEALIMNFRFDPRHGINTSHRALEAIEGMNHAIVARFPRAMAEIGAEYARVHDIDDFHFADPCDGFGTRNCRRQNTNDGMALPLNEGDLAARTQFCAAMQFGTTPGLTNVGPTLRATGFRLRGFPMNRGPLAHGGSSSRPNVREHINHHTGVGDLLRRFKDTYDADWMILPEYILRFPSYQRAGGPNLIGEQRRDGRNSFTNRFNTKFASLCAFGRSVTGPINWITRLEIETPDFTFWELQDIDPLSVTSLVQPDQMPDAFRILALSQRDKGPRLSASVLSETVESHFGYAQAGVFNPDTADLFSPNWQFRMMPATRVDDHRQIARDLRRQARSAFAPLATAFGAVNDSATWGRVNAH